MAKGKRYKKRLKKSKLRVLLSVIFVICILILSVSLFFKYKSNKDNNDLKDILTENFGDERIKQLEELQEINSDIIALLQIENTNIYYPVLQTSDNDFYITHNYKKEYSKDGSLFLDKDYDWNLPSTNLLIYGHNNIGSNEMFVELMNYKDEEFYNTHKTIRFTTNDENAEYEIIAVFLSRVYYKSEKDVFRYYYFINANNEEEFNEYIKSSKNSSLYNIEATATYGDQLLTLSTCEYSQEDGRLAIVARKINND